jgi:hypothetical protein
MKSAKHKERVHQDQSIYSELDEVFGDLAQSTDGVEPEMEIDTTRGDHRRNHCEIKNEYGTSNRAGANICKLSLAHMFKHQGSDDSPSPNVNTKGESCGNRNNRLLLAPVKAVKRFSRFPLPNGDDLPIKNLLPSFMKVAIRPVPNSKDLAHAVPFDFEAAARNLDAKMAQQALEAARPAEELSLSSKEKHAINTTTKRPKAHPSRESRMQRCPMALH